MSTTTEITSNSSSIDFRDSAARYQVNTFTHADQPEQHIHIFHNHKPLQDNGETICIFLQGQLGNNNFNRLYGIGSCILN